MWTQHCEVDIESCTVAAIGQADDVLLVSNSIYQLQLLCHLTETYCRSQELTVIHKVLILLCLSFIYRTEQNSLRNYSRADTPDTNHSGGNFFFSI